MHFDWGQLPSTKACRAERESEGGIELKNLGGSVRYIYPSSHLYQGSMSPGLVSEASYIWVHTVYLSDIPFCIEYSQI